MLATYDQFGGVLVSTGVTFALALLVNVITVASQLPPLFTSILHALALIAAIVVYLVGVRPMIRPVDDTSSIEAGILQMHIISAQ